MGSYVSKDILNVIKEDLKKINRSNQNITIFLNGTKRNTRTYSGKITGIYNNFLCVSSMVNDYEESFTISYPDIISGKVKIKEIDELLVQNKIEEDKNI